MNFRVPLALALLLLFLTSTAHAKVEDVTTFYIVRHAEKELAKKDPDLTPEGYLRAQRLLAFLRKRRVEAVYSTDTRRTRHTAQPVAKANQLPITSYDFDADAPGNWANSLIEKHRGQGVLLVGHSNTVPDMASALSGEAVSPLEHDDYDDLFVVTVYHSKDSSTSQLQHHFNGILKPLKYHSLVIEDTPLSEGEDLSAVTQAGEYLIVGADEEDRIQVLKWTEDANLEVGPLFSLETNGELDLEGLARFGETYYALGSHSRGRNNVSPTGRKSHNRSWQKNRRRLLASKVEAQLSRRQIVEFVYNLNTEIGPQVKHRINLQSLLENDPVLAPFTNIASKENGIDLEGIAVNEQGKLSVGFRGPVLRSGYVPIMQFHPDTPSDYELLFVNLQGRGVRDLLAVDGGFLVLAGPTGDSQLSYQLYYWDGLDCLPGQREPGAPDRGQMTLLGEVPAPTAGKAEGLTLLESDLKQWKILIVYDGIQNGFPTSFRIRKPYR